MTMQDDLDTCRICSAPAEPEAPLYHPCKCSGTIRYIHQDCLTTWLAHSKKKTCDVCKYQYSFTKIYSDNMPKHIPVILYLQKFVQKLFWGVVLLLRGVLVATIWLAFLPYVTVWTWRCYFAMGDNLAWWIFDQPRPTARPSFYSYFSNLTYTEGPLNPELNKTIVDIAMSYPVWRSLSSDIFTGQIIASLIVLVFLGVFLLREWIMQNARPGIFEDDVPEAPQPEVEVQDEAVDQVPDEVAESADEANENLDQHHPEPAPLPIIMGPIAPTRYERASNRKSFVPGEESDSDNSAPEDLYDKVRPPTPFARGSRETTPASPPPPRQRRRLTESESSCDEEDGAESIAHDGVRTRRRRSSTYSRHRARSVRRTLSKESRDAVDGFGRSDYRFTFSIDDLQQDRLQVSHSAQSSLGDTHEAGWSLETPEPISKEEDPSDEESTLYESLSSEIIMPSSATAIASGSEVGNEEKIGRVPQRPLLPNINLSTQGLGTTDDSLESSYALVSPVRDSWAQPKGSPSLATYHAPEQLEQGSSSLGPKKTEDAEGYFSKTEEEGANVLAQDSISETGSDATSVAATVADSAFREELDEYFREDDDAESDAGGNADERPIDGQGGEHRLEGNENNGQRAPDAPDEQDIELAEDQDGLNDDDVDGALEEALGMRGQISTVFQNAALMIFVLDTTIGLTIWLPFTLGKTTSLLMLDLDRLLHILQSPIRLIRLMTDPVVDFIILACARVFSLLPMPVPEEVGKDFSSTPFASGLAILQRLYGSTQVGRAAPGNHDGEASLITRCIEHFLSSPVGAFLEPYFAELGRQVRLYHIAFWETWSELAKGDESPDRMFAILVGYSIVFLLFALYLNIFSVGSVQSAGRAIRNAIRQQLVVLKVVVFILIELVFFPLGCGIMLDLYTMELFPSTNLQTRFAFFKYAPTTSIFYHWIIGTMFMYQFAILLGSCRRMLRQGALWFIRDPQDTNFHPIRDILERSTIVQLRKLAISAIMYSIVVALGMGGLVFSLRVWGAFVLPIRWKVREPLSAVPVDLLFLHIVMPYTMRYFRPRRILSVMAKEYWKWAARKLRLSSYLFNLTRPEETRPSRGFKCFFLSFLSLISEEDGVEGSPAFNGSYRRVPAQDNISIPRSISATVAVDADGQPLDEAGSRLMEIQNAEAEKARRDPKADYTVVYLPPHFKARIFAFLFLVWIAGSFVSVTGFVLPTLLGRAVFKLFIERDVHDAYSFVIGGYLLYGCVHLAHILDRMDKRRQRTAEEGPRGEFAVYVFKCTMLWIGNFVWVAIWLGFVIPTLLGIVMDVYVEHPLRLLVNPGLTLEIQIFRSWGSGLLFAKMALSTRRLRQETRVDVALKEMRENGWKRLDAVPITLDIILPMTAGLLGMLVLPLIVVLGLQKVLPSKITSNTLFLFIYPGIFVTTSIAHSINALKKIMCNWAQQIRDSEFLVEMRLRNLEQPEPQKPAQSAVTAPPQSVSPHEAAKAGVVTSVE